MFKNLSYFLFYIVIFNIVIFRIRNTIIVYICVVNYIQIMYFIYVRISYQFLWHLSLIFYLENLIKLIPEGYFNHFNNIVFKIIRLMALLLICRRIKIIITHFTYIWELIKMHFWFTIIIILILILIFL